MSNDARIIFHIDMNAFFAAVEELDHPEYRGQPIIVGGDPDGRGVVSTASYAARQWGIHSGMPVARARALCPQVIILPVNMERYRAVSSQLMAYFRTLTPLVEPFSIDEAYLDMTGLAQSWEHAIAWAKTIKRDIKARFGLTTSVGIGPNKLLAKMASGMENRTVWLCCVTRTCRQSFGLCLLMNCSGLDLPLPLLCVRSAWPQLVIGAGAGRF